MTVDAFWRRVPADDVKGREPAALRDLVPYFLDDEYAAESDRGTLVGVEDTGALIGALLRLGTAGGPWAATVRLFAKLPPDWDDHWMVGTLEPDTVRQIAELFSHAELDAWADRHAAALAEEASRQGYLGPQHESVMEQLLGDAHEVAALFGAAAADGEAVVFRLVV